MVSEKTTKDPPTQSNRGAFQDNTIVAAECSAIVDEQPRQADIWK